MQASQSNQQAKTRSVRKSGYVIAIFEVLVQRETSISLWAIITDIVVDDLCSAE